MQETPRVLPVDRWVALVNLLILSTWLPLAPHFQAAYFSYYLMLAAVPVALLTARDAAGRREVVLRVALTYLGCFLIYSCFPVVGPRETWPIAHGDLTAGWFYRINLGIRTAGDSLATVYTQNDFAVDTAAGIAVAVLLQGGVAPALLGLRPRRAPTPALVPANLTEPA